MYKKLLMGARHGLAIKNMQNEPLCLQKHLIPPKKTYLQSFFYLLIYKQLMWSNLVGYKIQLALQIIDG